jgi:hypothetical protein
MPELIDREQAGKNICKYCASNAYCKEDDCMVYQGLGDTPTIQIEAKLVRRGRWIETTVRGNQSIICSACSAENQTICPSNFCPNCGARMDGGADNGD